MAPYLRIQDKTPNNIFSQCCSSLNEHATLMLPFSSCTVVYSTYDRFFFCHQDSEGIGTPFLWFEDEVCIQKAYL